MAAKPPFVLHQPKHQHPEQRSHGHHTRLPIIPDLRFEHSYLRSIQPYVAIRHVPTHSTNLESEYVNLDGSEEVEKGQELQNVRSEVIHIQWGRVTWVTTRDQIISPLLQGALWALASYLLTPFSAQLGSHMGTLAHSRLSPSKEGMGVGWLRNWASGLGFGSTTTDARRSQ